MKLIVSDIYQSVKDKAEELQIGTVSAIGVYKEMCVLCVNTAISLIQPVIAQNCYGYTLIGNAKKLQE